VTIGEVVWKVLRDERADVIREGVRAVAQEIMEAEVWELVGAERGERRPGDRPAHRNGCRPRRWDARVGAIELLISKLRQGSCFPGFLQPRKRSEQALVSVVQQAYVCGVSTRRVDQSSGGGGNRTPNSALQRRACVARRSVRAGGTEFSGARAE